MATKTNPIPVVWGWNKADNDWREINWSYLHLTNVRPTELPYYNSYRNNFTNLESRSDRGWTAWNIRKPLYSCGWIENLWENSDGTINVDDPFNYFVRDSICCWGDRFFLIDTPSIKENWFCDDRFLIAKQCDSSYEAWCETIFRDCCVPWPLKVLGSYPHKPCTYDKFTKMKWPKGKPKYESDKAVLRVDKKWEYLFWSVYDENGNIQGNVWDWIYIKDDNGPFQANAWYLNQITWSNFNYSCWWGSGSNANLIVSAPWPDIVPVSDSVNQSASVYDWDISEILDESFSVDPLPGTTWEDLCSFYEYKYVSVCIYEEVWETFSFATSDGVVMYNGDDACDGDEDEEWYFSTIPNSEPSEWNSSNNGQDCDWWVLITSVFNYYGQTWYIVNWNIILNSPWSFLTDSVLDADEYGYTHAIPVNDLLVFIGPNSAWALTNSTIGRQLSPIFNQQGSGIWYFNPWSYVNRLEDFYMVSNGGHLYQLSFSSSLVDNTWQYVFKPVIEDLDLFLRHDLGMLRKEKWDYVYMSADEDHLEMYIWSKAHNYTQRRLLDKHDSVWYDEKICGAQIYGKKCGCFYGVSWLYNFDEKWIQVEDSVNQLVSWIVDVSRSNRKYFNFLRIDIWYNSNISKNTILKVKFIDDGCETEKLFRLDNFPYVQDLNNQKLMREDEIISNNWAMLKYPQKVKKEEPCFAKEMKAFCDYKLSHKDVMSYCDDYVASKDCDDINEKTPKSKVAKFATLHFPLQVHGHVAKRELSSHSWDNVEYLSAYMELWYTDWIDQNKHTTFNAGIS